MMLMEKKWGGGHRILGDFLIVGQSGVDLFFVISGFVMFTITRDRFQDHRAILRYGYNRLTRIYPTYWFYSLVLAMVYCVRPALINPTMGNQVNFIASFLLLPQDTLPLLMVGWTLVYEMYFYFVFALLMLAPQKHLYKIMLLWAAFIITATCFQNRTGIRNMIALDTLFTSPLCIEFIGGSLVANIIFSGFFKWRRACLTIGVAALIGTSIWAWISPSITIINPMHRLLLFGLPYMALIYGAVAMELSENRLVCAFLSPIGDASYSIYLSHTIVINAIGWLWYNLAGRSSNLLWLFLMLTTSIAIGLISYRFIEIPALQFFKKIAPVCGMHPNPLSINHQPSTNNQPNQP